MKKLISAFVIVGITILATSKEAKSQNTSGRLLMEAAIVSADANGITAGSNNEISRDQVNARALRHFDKVFKTAADAKWQVLSDGFMASFKANEIIERVYYYSNGNLAGTLKGYSAKKMPQEIYDMVKGSYPGYPIVYVDEAEVEGASRITAFIVHLQNQQGLKLVRIIDDEMDVMYDSEQNAKSPSRF